MGQRFAATSWIFAHVHGLVGKEQEGHEVHEVGAHVGEGLALLARVEEPGGTQQGRPRRHLHQVVHAVHVEGRLLGRARPHLTRHRAVAHELALQDRGDLVALGHHVVGHEALLLGGVEGGLELGPVRGVDDPRLVGEDVEPRFHRGQDAVDLAAVAPRDHHHVARALPEHPLHEVGAGVHLELPARGVLGRGG